MDILRKRLQSSETQSYCRPNCGATSATNVLARPFGRNLREPRITRITRKGTAIIRVISESASGSLSFFFEQTIGPEPTDDAHDNCSGEQDACPGKVGDGAKSE